MVALQHLPTWGLVTKSWAGQANDVQDTIGEHGEYVRNRLPVNGLVSSPIVLGTRNRDVQ